MGAASTTVSCVCASLLLPWPVCQPAVAFGAFPAARSGRSLLAH